jgi:hypothetical protein
MSSLTEILEQQSVVLVEATIPADMTIAEWRRRRARPDRPARRHRFERRSRRLLSGGAR